MVGSQSTQKEPMQERGEHREGHEFEPRTLLLFLVYAKLS